MRKILFIIMLLAPALVYGQDAAQIPVTVTQLAGQDVYLDAGRDQGIATGNTLQFTESGVVRRLQVVTVSRSQCVAQFADAPFAVTRGQRLLVTVLKVNSAVQEGRASEPVIDPLNMEDVVSVMEDQPADRTRRNTRRSSKVGVEGRLIVSASALSSETRIRSNTVNPVSRLYLTPSINLNTTITNLPSDVRLQLHMRSDYRYQSRNTVAPVNSFRAYQIRFEKTLPFGQLQAGRFYNRFTQRGGYWDGLSFIVGNRKKGIGGSLGFMPDRSNEGFTTQFPRYSVFAHYETSRRSSVRYKASVTWNEIRPSTDFLAHKYAGVEQRLDLDFLSFDQDLQLDQDPVTKNWVVSHLQFNTRASVGTRLQLHGRYALRQPYRMFNLDRPFLTRRDQYAGGLRLRFESFSLGGNYAVRYLNESYEGRTISGYFNTRPLTLLRLEFSGSGNHWASDIGDALFVNGGIARNFKKLYVRTDYGFYRSYSPNVDRPIDMNRYSLSVSMPLSRKLFWTMRGNLQQSQFLNSFSVYTSLQVRF